MLPAAFTSAVSQALDCDITELPINPKMLSNQIKLLQLKKDSNQQEVQ
ncbi:MAG: hypothetical protein IKZ04_04190 [Spirochaetaceae bacterium]|nr:hypothetical protein [Spirochaetaceae bacterium]